MRRVVTVITLLLVALALAACSSAPADTGTTGTAGAPASGVPVAPAAVAPAVAAASGDILSPTQTVTPGEMLPTDQTIIPATIMANITGKKPMLILWVDPTTKVAHDARVSANSAVSKYRGEIQLVVLDYTDGLSSNAASATLDPETQKIELFTAALRVNTTPYMVFVDKFSRITYRFAGWTDKDLLRREVLRAIQ
jgi:thioredoxin-related protein